MKMDSTTTYRYRVRSSFRCLAQASLAFAALSLAALSARAQELQKAPGAEVYDLTPKPGRTPRSGSSRLRQPTPPPDLEASRYL